MTTNGGGVAASSGAHTAGGAATAEGNVSPPNSETGMRRMVVNDREIREGDDRCGEAGILNF